MQIYTHEQQVIDRVAHDLQTRDPAFAARLARLANRLHRAPQKVHTPIVTIVAALALLTMTVGGTTIAGNTPFEGGQRCNTTHAARHHTSQTCSTQSAHRATTTAHSNTSKSDQSSRQKHHDRSQPRKAAPSTLSPRITSAGGNRHEGNRVYAARRQ